MYAALDQSSAWDAAEWSLPRENAIYYTHAAYTLHTITPPSLLT